MTDYFEVHARDGAARIGELRLSDSLTTPAVADDVLADAGSLWAAEREMPDGDDDTLTVLPNRSLPAGSADEIRESFSVEYPDVDFPSAAVVTADTAGDYGADAYILSDAQGFVGHARAFRDNIVEAKSNLPADTALMLSGVATPRNVSLLAYAGVDLVDETRARARGLEGFYLSTDGEYFLEDLDELPCACAACRKPASEFTRADAAEHNANALRAELARVRRRIRDGRLRDYIEGQARNDQWLTAAFRRFDQQFSFMEERTPVIRNAELTAASEESIDRVEIQRFADRVTTRYKNRFDNPLVLLPCSAKKPYSESQSHRQFQEAVQYRAHMVSMTSPIGVVPQELELTYPAQHYDSVVTGDWSEDEKSFVTEVLRRYLERNDYPRIIAHVPPGAYTEIVERVEADLGLDVEYTVSEHPTTTESIGNLMRTLDGEPKFTREAREHNVVKAIADYQLGPEAGDALFSGVELDMTSRFPKLQVWNGEGEQLATMVPQYGVISFTLEGAKVWRDSDAPTKTVEIDGFVPHGSVLAPGIVDADAEIRPGDEVIVEGPKAFAIGRAEMSGAEMVDSTRGIGVEIRHVEER
ncbi:putative archaeosine tRNA-ribosyltransferase [Haloferax mucosum ATCC BAA-1512]|uniref:Putative archaeosine tRNA-ribosyltransferase n=1 Tax=Haloferax mucosum ATCC BAA-1512 TaxID=662479 RepID=M0I0L6_9EURY|nr:archaeosine synthase subunit alpha [Haloferax mucosum]ELZ90380.1 putative archaeosine tRNA-ribosyltransferase [Haloferax mucosum ATCC BAA-1512]